MTATAVSRTQPLLTCSECAAPMADGQRYCLDCGARRPDVQAPLARAHFPAATLPAEPGAFPRRGLLGRLSTNAGLIGGVACLLLAMGVGVLIGHAGRSPAKVTAAPQVVTVSGAAAPAATLAAAAPAKHAATKHTRSAKKKSPSVSDLSKTTSPSDYAKKSKKLPKVVTTHGKAVKKDNKKGGGGTDFQTIG